MRKLITYLLIILGTLRAGTCDLAISGAPYSVTECDAVNTQIAAAGSGGIDPCAGSVDCTANVPRVRFLNPADDAINPFSILATGELKLAKPELLDFEDSNKNSFKVVIAVEYEYEQPRDANQFASFTIDVTNCNENPYWIKAPSYVSVAESDTAVTLTGISDFIFWDPENDKSGATATAMTCTLSDCAAFEFVGDSSKGVCTMQTVGGQILDFDAPTIPNNIMTCKAKACEATGECTNEVTFEVQILDIDDELPAPVAASAAATVNSKVPAGTALTLAPAVSWTDVDSDVSELVYTLETGTHPDANITTANNFQLFTIDPSGTIRVRGDESLDVGSYYFDIFATDPAGNKATASVSVDVTVVLENRLPPECTNEYVLRSQSAEGYYVDIEFLRSLASGASDPGCMDPEGQALTFGFAIATTADIGPISHMEWTGGSSSVLRVGIDYDSMTSLEILATATDSGGTNTFTSTVTVAIIAPARNEPYTGATLNPKMTDSITTAKVQEGAAAGSVVIGPRTAYDYDRSEQHSEYYFKGSFAPTTPCSKLFVVDPATGAVILTKEFNYGDLFTGAVTASSTCTYTAQICNIDNTCTNQPTVAITVENADDTPAYISSGSTWVEVAENAAIGDNVYTVAVVDKDDPTAASVSYVLSGEPAALEFFKLNGADLDVKKVPDIDRGGQREFTCTITASDADSLSKDVVNVFVTITPADEFDPAFEASNPVSVTLTENNKQPEYLVGRYIVHDYDVPDHGVDQITFALTGDTGGYFYIKPTGLNLDLFAVYVELRVAKILDYEVLTASYDLKIEARGTGSGGATTVTLTVSIAIKDVVDIRPICSAVFQASIAEDQPALTNVGPVINCANEPTTGLVFSSGNSDFEFNGNQMRIASGVTLDYETYQKAVFKITVEDKQGFFVSEITAKVEVTPVDEFNPTFQPSAIADVSLPESTPIGTTVAMVTVKDLDLSTAHMIDLSKIALVSTFSNTFDVMAVAVDNGYRVDVVLADGLDASATSDYTLTLKASNPADSTPAQISFSLNVTDVNDFFPACSKRVFAVDRDEGAGSSGAVLLGDLGCTDQDPGDSATLAYTIASDPSGLFEVTTAAPGGTFKLKAGKELDYDIENGQQHVVQISVTDSGFKVTPVYVIVNVGHLNDGPPAFDNTDAIVLPETTPIGDCFYTFQATDPDWSRQNDGVVIYKLMAASSQFWIDESAGKLCIKGVVDYDTTPSVTSSISVDVAAEDLSGSASGTQTFTVVVTNVNDNPPVCGSAAYVKGSIAEGAGINTVIANMGCSDADGDAVLTYNRNNEAFNIKANGDIENALMFDYEATTNGEISFVVEVTDSSGSGNSHTIQVPVTITVTPVNEGGPVCVTKQDSSATITTYHASIVENSPVGTEILTVFARDLADQKSDDGIPDSATDTYAISGTPNYFSINPMTGRLSVAAPLDREKTTEIVTKIQISDAATSPNLNTCTVTVTITDTNDHCPVFDQSSYTVSIDEGTTTVGLTVSASDYDAASPAHDVTYSIIETTAPTGLFTVGSTSGTLAVTSAPDYEVMSTPYYTVVVQAQDNAGKTGFCTSTVTVGVTIVHKNDNTPTLNKATYTATIPENTAVGSLIISSVYTYDEDRGTDGTFYYAIVNSGSTPFMIERDSGKIRLAKRLDIDDNQASQDFTFTFGVYDNGSPQNSDSATVTITVTDSNDNVPLCVSYSVQESVLESETLPHSTTAAFSCSDAKDHSSTTTIGYQIISINGEDVNIFESKSEARFSMSTSSAGVVVIDGKLDYETEHLYILSVNVSDSTTAPLYVTLTFRVNIVRDFTSNAAFLQSVSTFTAEVSEGVSIPHAVIDLQTNYELAQYAIAYVKQTASETKFAVDVHNGTVYIVEGLDRETTSLHVLEIAVILDSSYTLTGVTGTATATLSVTVTDENDNPPVFTPKRYVTTVPEDAVTGTIVAILTLSDADAGANGDIASVVISSGDPSSKFSITADNKLQVAAALDYDGVLNEWANYTLKIKATDAAISPAVPRSSTATVFVEILPVNEAEPMFSSSSGYTFTISESDPIGTVVGSVPATDSDKPALTDGGFIYVISDPSSNDFWINQSNGTIKLRQKIDYEAPKAEVVLTIEARDFGRNSKRLASPLTGTTSVTINIQDVNDVQPTCGTGSLFRAFVDETSSGPTSDLTVFDLSQHCSDTDYTLAYRTLNYSIESYTPASMSQLQIGATSGLLFLPTSQAISYDTSPNVTVTVKITDNAGVCTAPGSCNELQVKVFVSIQNVNQFTPTLFTTSSSYYVNETTVTDRNVSRVFAVDGDSGADGTITWFIQSGNTNGDFKIVATGDANAIDIYTARDLDRERTAVYNLVVIAKDAGTNPSRKTGFR